MDNIVITIITAVAALAVGFIIAKMLEKNNAATAIASAKKEAVSIIKNAEKDGESLKKDKMLQAKERFQFFEHTLQIVSPRILGYNN